MYFYICVEGGQINIFQCVNGYYHWWITLQVFVFFIEAIFVCYRKYRSAKRKKLLFELKRKKNYKSGSSSNRRLGTKERRSKNRRDIGRLIALPVTPVLVFPYRWTLPEQACGAFHLPQKQATTYTAPGDARRAATYKNGKVQGTWRANLALWSECAPEAALATQASLRGAEHRSADTQTAVRAARQTQCLPPSPSVAILTLPGIFPSYKGACMCLPFHNNNPWRQDVIIPFFR